MSEVNLIDLKGIYKSFYGSTALDGLDFSIGQGEVRSLIGENGCGKSTAIKIISGFYTYDSGEVWFNGQLQKNIKPQDAMRAGIQVIYQDFSLFPNLSVAENIMMNNTMLSKGQRVRWNEMRRTADDLLHKISNTDISSELLVEDLNVANKQIVAICRALAQDAKLIIMDEPTSALTYKEIQNLYAIVQNLTERGISVLFVSHKLDEVKEVSNQVTIMRNGKNVYSGDASSLTRDDMIFHMTGREIIPSNYLYSRQDDDPVMEVDKLTLEPYFRDISFQLYQGEILGITGLLGCGRSELAKALFGVMPYNEGSIRIHGVTANIKKVSDGINHGLGYVPEDRLTEGLHLQRSIGENAIVCVLKNLLTRLKTLDKKRAEETKKKALQRVTIAGLELNKAVQALSGGNQQKVLMIKWLELEPDILILNCPTVGVDVGSRSDLHKIIRRIVEEGISVILISDDIPEIIQVCNRVIVMQDGRIMFETNTADATVSELENRLIID